jgi:hypothetical protein
MQNPCDKISHKLFDNKQYNFVVSTIYNIYIIFTNNTLSVLSLQYITGMNSLISDLDTKISAYLNEVMCIYDLKKCTCGGCQFVFTFVCGCELALKFQTSNCELVAKNV